MLEWEFKGEVTPEELRKRFEEYENKPGYLQSDVIEYLMPYMVAEILRANADAMTKAQAIFYLGELYGALDGLSRLVSRLTRGTGSYEELKESYEFIYEYIMRTATDRLIDLYEGLKKGWPLNDIKETLKNLASDVEFGSFEYDVGPIVRLIRKQKPS